MIAIDEQELTPQESEAVRRLLAGARHDEPMPPEVVGRLDAVLADLREDPDARPGGVESAASAPTVGDTSGRGTEGAAPADTVTPLRRRSKLPQMLLAAAAVVAVGFGVTQILPTGDDDGSAGDTTFSSDQAPDAGGADEAPEGGGPSMGAQPPSDAEKDQTFKADARLRRLLDRVPLPELGAPVKNGFAARRVLASCGPESLAAGERRTPATYEDEPAVVVFRVGADGKRQADIYLCTTDDPREPLTSVTLTAP